jgi:asparagine synthase (glutamine-hydrolysing)
MGFQPYHTHPRSTLEAQPILGASGNMLTFDGRLDNFVELQTLLDFRIEQPSDSQIVLAAFERWGAKCFARLTGDWALALWSSSDGILYLARDHAGTRTLFYEEKDGTLRWSTYLEAFFTIEVERTPDEGYAASYLCLSPKHDLTPYKGIRAIPPGHYLAVRNGAIGIERHWEWLAEGRPSYKTDAEYEEHFLHLFEQSVLRRTAPGVPILAQLSGGMDSSSIVCVCDRARRAINPTPELLDTVSYFDDSEPGWNEKPYFSLVEASRGKSGLHVDISLRDRTFGLPDFPLAPALVPGTDRSSLDGERRFESLIEGKGYRAVLSGIGGDELLGGVPTPLPELANRLTGRQFRQLLDQATKWSLINRSPLLGLLFDTARFTANLYIQAYPKIQASPPWVAPRLREQLLGHFHGNAYMRGRWRRTPSSISNGQTWWTILETLPHNIPATLTRLEYRYPYLDKDLVDFLLRIPREQLVQPGRRRFLMRRALKGIVPTEILERRRKASITRGPLARLQEAHQDIVRLFKDSRTADCGWIAPDRFLQKLDETVNGAELKWWPALTRTIALELWLRGDPMGVAV